MARHVVGAVDEIPPGSRKLVEADGKKIVVFNLGGEFFALMLLALSGVFLVSTANDLILLFLAIELRSAHPAIDPRLFRSRAFGSAAAAGPASRRA